MKDRLIKILDIFIKIGLGLTVLGAIAFPLIFTAFTKTLVNSGFIKDASNIRDLGLIGFYLIVIPYVFAILNISKVTSLLVKKDTYNKDIITYLKKSGYILMVISFLFIGLNLLFYILTEIYLYALTIIFVTVIPFIFITVGLVFLVVSYIYEEVIDIKEENDLTI